MTLPRIRVLHCPDIVGGNPQNLARAERELGIESWSVAFRQTIFSYPCDEILIKPGDSFLNGLLARFGLFLRGLYKYDLIHYNYGHTIFPTHTHKSLERNFPYHTWDFLRNLLFMADLKIYHKVGKGIAVTFQGDDIRQGDFSLEHFDISIAKTLGSGYYSTESDSDKKLIIDNFNRYADLIYYLNPDLGHILPSRAKFLPYANVDLREWQKVDAPKKSEPLIIHAPSHRGVKGTEIIIDTMSRLKKEGYKFDFKLVEGLSNLEAKKIYQQADLLIDQLFSGWYGGLAVELMALGKPVIAYIRESDLVFIPEMMRQEIPIINATADTLFNTLKNIMRGEIELDRIGEVGRKYVENWHNPLVIAEQLKKDYSEILFLKSGSHSKQKPSEL